MSGSFADVQRGHLLTEQANPSSAELDALSTADLVAVFVEGTGVPRRLWRLRHQP